MLRHGYDSCEINHTVSQVENLRRTGNWACDDLRRTSFKIFCRAAEISD